MDYTNRKIVMAAVTNDGLALLHAPAFQKEYNFYERILNFKELKINMWKKNGIAQQLMEYFYNPNLIK